MGRRLPRQTARKSTGGRGLPDKTNNARDINEDDSEDHRGKRPVTGDGGGAVDQTPQDAYRPLTPSERDAYRPLTPPESKEVRLLQRLNETHVFEKHVSHWSLQTSPGTHLYRPCRFRWNRIRSNPSHSPHIDTSTHTQTHTHTPDGVPTLRDLQVLL
jgi:hypothetical protein